MTSCDYPALAVVGPTASGKTPLALALAREFCGEIVSCDALQVYEHMNIGTAKATQAEKEEIPHHMIDLREPDKNFSAGDYQREARRALETIRARMHLPIVAGGTGFYLRGLVEGFFEGPGRSDALRARMRRIIERRGVRCLHRALTRVDPEAAKRIYETDTARTIRAYEIYLLTGKTMSWWQCQPRVALRGFRWLYLGIEWPREVLYQRINRRVEEMFRAGFVDEVRFLLDKYARDCHALKSIGYRQIAEYLGGACTLEQAIEDTQRQSRRYAKRQLTWFRAQKEVVWLDGTPGWEKLHDEAISRARAFLDSPPSSSL